MEQMRRNLGKLFIAFIFIILISNVSIAFTPIEGGEGDKGGKPSGPCSDTDNGVNIFDYGSVSGVFNSTPFTYYDSCVSGYPDVVKEYYCSRADITPDGSEVIVPKFVYRSCPDNYTCNSGRCVPTFSKCPHLQNPIGEVCYIKFLRITQLPCTCFGAGGKEQLCANYSDQRVASLCKYFDNGEPILSEKALNQLGFNSSPFFYNPINNCTEPSPNVRSFWCEGGFAIDSRTTKITCKDIEEEIIERSSLYGGIKFVTYSSSLLNDTSRLLNYTSCSYKTVMSDLRGFSAYRHPIVETDPTGCSMPACTIDEFFNSALGDNTILAYAREGSAENMNIISSLSSCGYGYKLSYTQASGDEAFPPYQSTAAYCKPLDCDLIFVSINGSFPPNSTGYGFFGMEGEDCNMLNILQLDINSTDGTCHIEYDPSRSTGGVSGLTINLNDTNFYNSIDNVEIYNFTFDPEFFPYECRNKTLFISAAGLWDGENPFNGHLVSLLTNSNPAGGTFGLENNQEEGEETK